MHPRDLDALIPFPHKESPHLSRVYDGHVAWMRKHGLLPHDTASEVYMTWGTPELATYVYTDATPAGLRLGMDLMGWFFPFDDIFDGPLRLEPGRTADLIATMIDLLHAPPGTHPRVEVPATTAFADIWSRSVAEMSPAWRARAVANWTVYFTAYTKESAIRTSGEAVTLKDCLELRREAVGLAPAADLNEPATGYEVPDRAWRSRHLGAMLRITTDAVCLVNDAWSAQKEVAAGEILNAVLFVQRNSGCPRSTAVAEIGALLRECVQDFQRMDLQAPAMLDSLGLTDAEREATNRYIRHLRHWFRANYDWSSRTGRYTHQAVLPDTHLEL